MRPILFSHQMRATENAYFESGESSLKLMENAAARLTEILIQRVGCAGKTCVFACGTGGNGGDGFAAARMFARGGGRAIVLLTGEVKQKDAQTNLARAKACVYGFATPSDMDALPPADAWVDALFGIGFNRPVSDDIARVIAQINQARTAGAFVLSADIPSGLCADTGEVLGACVRADETVTFQVRKIGHLLGRGPEMCGKVTVCDIGLPERFIAADAPLLVEPKDAYQALPPRPRDAHKNDFGHLLIVAGSRGMAGAALLCARAALRAGTGLVTVACVQSIVDIIQLGAPCAMCVPLPETDGAISRDARPILDRALIGKNACAVGPGLSARADAGCIELILRAPVPAVIDADALNIIAQSPALQALLAPRHIITPHPGEAARLNDGERLPPIAAITRLSCFPSVPLLKGAVSLIAGDKLYFSASGTVGMAKGGSGDALTGVLSALLAQGVAPQTAAWAASELHGLAGEEAAKRFGTIAMSPADLIDALPAVFLRYGNA